VNPSVPAVSRSRAAPRSSPRCHQYPNITGSAACGADSAYRTTPKRTPNDRGWNRGCFCTEAMARRSSRGTRSLPRLARGIRYRSARFELQHIHARLAQDASWRPWVCASPAPGPPPHHAARARHARPPAGARLPGYVRIEAGARGRHHVRGDVALLTRRSSRHCPPPVRSACRELPVGRSLVGPTRRGGVVAGAGGGGPGME